MCPTQLFYYIELLDFSTRERDERFYGVRQLTVAWRKTGITCSLYRNKKVYPGEEIPKFPHGGIDESPTSLIAPRQNCLHQRTNRLFLIFAVVRACDVCGTSTVESHDASATIMLANAKIVFGKWFYGSSTYLANITVNHATSWIRTIKAGSIEAKFPPMRR